LSEPSHEHGIAFIRPAVNDCLILERYTEAISAVEESTETDGQKKNMEELGIADSPHFSGDGIEKDILQIGIGITDL
jgi:hypothetical protein